MASLEAVPTEYKGVVYRSKSEAMFARWIELHYGEEGEPFGFVYEPKHLETSDGWVPDFLVWQVQNTTCWVPQLSVMVFEYKPSKPTDTYVSRFNSRCRELQSRTNTRMLFCLMFGSVFTQDRGCFWGESESNPNQSVSRIDWIDRFEKDIRATRFDLEVARNG